MKIKTISGTITKKGRKWFKFRFDNQKKDKDYDLEISPSIKDLKPGEHFELKVYEEWSDKGMYSKVSYHEYTDNVAANKDREKERLMNIIRDKALNEGYIFEKLVNELGPGNKYEEEIKGLRIEVLKKQFHSAKSCRTLKEIKSALHRLSYNELDAEIEAEIAKREPAEKLEQENFEKKRAIENAIHWIRYNWNESKTLYNKGIMTLEEYNCHDYDDEIAKYKAELEKYIVFMKNCEYYEQYEVGALVYRDGKAYKIISKKFISEDEGIQPWDSYRYRCENVSETEEGKIFIEKSRKRLELLDEAKKIEKRKKELISQIEKMTEKNDILAHDCEDQISLPEFEKVIDTFNVYGGGKQIGYNEEFCYYIQNNGGDGDFWGANNILTGGAGAIGYACKKEFVADSLAELKDAIKKASAIENELNAIEDELNEL